jgi:hypothetical protein
MQGKKSLILSVFIFLIVFVSLPMSYPTFRAGTQSASAQNRTAELNPQVKPSEGKESADPLPQIKWNKSPEQIAQHVDKMIAAVNQSNPLGRATQMVFTRALSNVRDAVVKNDMAAYQKAVTALAEVSSTLTAKEKSKLDEVLGPINPGGSVCSVDCGQFGYCAITCSYGVIASCSCAPWGLPVCRCKEVPPRPRKDPSGRA